MTPDHRAEHAQGMVDAIWANFGRIYSPKAHPLSRRARTLLCRADRLTIELATALPLMAPAA